MRFHLIFSIFLFPWLLMAQGNKNFYIGQASQYSEIGLRVGVINSLTSIRSAPNITLEGVKSKIGLCIGGYYAKSMSSNNQIVYRMEANLQAKGVEITNGAGKAVVNANYYYLGFTPSLGVSLMRNLIVCFGPEMNLLFAKSNPVYKGFPVEIGGTARIIYSFRSISFDVSYFNGFTKYDQLESTPTANPLHEFYNRNWQIGMSYKLK